MAAGRVAKEIRQEVRKTFRPIADEVSRNVGQIRTSLESTQTKALKEIDGYKAAAMAKIDAEAKIRTKLLPHIITALVTLSLSIAFTLAFVAWR
jgi:hypothetical protein